MPTPPKHCLLHTLCLTLLRQFYQIHSTSESSSPSAPSAANPAPPPTPTPSLPYSVDHPLALSHLPLFAVPYSSLLVSNSLRVLGSPYPTSLRSHVLLLCSGCAPLMSFPSNHTGSSYWMGASDVLHMVPSARRMSRVSPICTIFSYCSLCSHCLTPRMVVVHTQTPS